MIKNETIWYRKLVRDKIPQAIIDSGGNPHCLELGHDAFVESLYRKLYEEVQELEATSHVIDEAADIYEVLKALVEASGFTWDAVLKEADRKAIAKGRFEKRFYLVYTD